MVTKPFLYTGLLFSVQELVAGLGGEGSVVNGGCC